MIENATDITIRRAIEKAHSERARAFQNAWSWLFSN